MSGHTFDDGDLTYCLPSFLTQRSNLSPLQSASQFDAYGPIHCGGCRKQTAPLQPMNDHMEEKASRQYQQLSSEANIPPADWITGVDYDDED